MANDLRNRSCGNVDGTFLAGLSFCAKSSQTLCGIALRHELHKMSTSLKALYE